jgi:hypothetical protein
MSKTITEQTVNTRTISDGARPFEVVAILVKRSMMRVRRMPSALSDLL